MLILHSTVLCTLTGGAQLWAWSQWHIVELGNQYSSCQNGQRVGWRDSSLIQTLNRWYNNMAFMFLSCEMFCCFYVCFLVLGLWLGFFNIFFIQFFCLLVISSFFFFFFGWWWGWEGGLLVWYILFICKNKQKYEGKITACVQLSLWGLCKMMGVCWSVLILPWSCLWPRHQWKDSDVH